jgi:phosphate:Na+ symporter
VIQSSSATTVMVVGFVNSGIMTLKQAVGVIMGSNVGTTITSWILSLSGLEGDSFLIKFFKPSTLAPLIGTVGIVLFMFTKGDSKKGIGTIMLGFLALMTGMDIMGDSMEFLENEPWFAQLMISFTNPIIGILFGAVLTAVIQSSSASVGILQGLCVTGAVTYGSAIPIILGQNIGTCVTAMMGSIGANRNARRTAMVHLLFNIVGVALFAVVFYGIGLVRPWAFMGESVQAWDISLIHTAFNLGATAVLLPMNGLLVKLAYLIIPHEYTPQKEELLDERLLATPAVAVQRSHEITVRMMDAAREAVELAICLTKEYSEENMARVQALEDETDRYQDALGSYLVKLSGAKMNHDDNRTLNNLLYTISDIERIGDHALNLAEAAKEMFEKKVNFSEAAKAELEVLEQAVLDMLAKTAKAFELTDLARAMKVEPHEEVIDALVREVKSRHVRRLRDGKCTVEYGFVLDDLLTSYERIADHCSNMAVEMLQTAEDKMEVHEYLNALRAGELDESAKYNQRIGKYTERYQFPEEV